VFNIAAILTALSSQKERVTWVLIAMFAGYWLLTFGMEIGELKSDNHYQQDAIELLTDQLEGCGG